MQIWKDIRQHVLVDGKSRRWVSRTYGMHRKTVAKILACSAPEPYRLGLPRKKTMIGDYLPIIEQILKDDQTAPRKQRHTSMRIWARLRDEHDFTGGYTTVNDAVQSFKRSYSEVFVPLTHNPGEAQMDFGEATVRVAGVEVKAHLCVLTLPYSDVMYVQAYPRECSETFFDGHVRAFSFFGGVPTRISYDNSRIPVKKIVSAHGRELTDGFLRFQSHHLFTEHFCRVRCPNEKGHVETLVQYSRNNFLVPVPDVASFDDLNQMLHDRCAAELDRTVRGESRTKGQRLEEDRRAFLEMPSEMFEAKRVVLTQASKLSLVRFDSNDYSVPTEYAHHVVTAVGTVSEVRLLVNDEVIATHARVWDKGQYIFNPVHYLALLEKKPGALDFAKPLENFGLPSCFGILRRRLEADLGSKGTKEYIRVLRLLEHATLKQLADSVELAIDKNLSSADAVRVLLEGRKERPVDAFNLDGHPHLKLVRVKSPNLSAYKILMPPSASTLRLVGGVQ